MFSLNGNSGGGVCLHPSTWQTEASWLAQGYIERELGGEGAEKGFSV